MLNWLLISTLLLLTLVQPLVSLKHFASFKVDMEKMLYSEKLLRKIENGDFTFLRRCDTIAVRIVLRNFS